MVHRAMAIVWLLPEKIVKRITGKKERWNTRPAQVSCFLETRVIYGPFHVVWDAVLMQAYALH